MRVNVLTPGFTTSNGSALLFPLVVFKKTIQKAGMEIKFVKRSDKKISDCDILAIDSKAFMTLPVQALDLIDSYRKSNNKKFQMVDPLRPPAHWHHQLLQIQHAVAAAQVQQTAGPSLWAADPTEARQKSFFFFWVASSATSSRRFTQ